MAGEDVEWRKTGKDWERERLGNLEAFVHCETMAI